MRSERLFFLLAYALSWSVWLPIAATDAERSVLGGLAVGLGAAGPSVAGLLCTGRDEGRRGFRRLLRSLLEWRVGAKWYFLALGIPIALALVAVAVHRLVIGGDARFRLETSTLLLVPPALVVGLFIGSLQEELGWRGYALPRLLDRWGGVRASLVIGVAWAFWHVPLYLLDPGGPDRAPLTLFLISTVALSFLYTWFWIETSGRLLIALLLHSATNVAGVLLLRDARSDFGPVVVATVLTVAVGAVAARYLLWRWPNIKAEGDPGRR